jgi:hypothetical protein
MVLVDLSMTLITLSSATNPTYYALRTRPSTVQIKAVVHHIMEISTSEPETRNYIIILNKSNHCVVKSFN